MSADNRNNTDFDGFDFEEHREDQSYNYGEYVEPQNNNQVNPQANQVEITNEPDNRVLYIVIDKRIPGLLRFFRESGVRVAKIFTSIDDAKGVLLMEDRKLRVAVIDTGTGRFVAASNRRELVDMIGVSDEEAKFTVFYTDSTLKTELQESLYGTDKPVDWVSYTGNTVVAATLLSYSDNFILSKSEIEFQEKTESIEDMLDFIGEDPDCNLAPPMIITGFNKDQIEIGMSGQGFAELPGFVPHI